MDHDIFKQIGANIASMLEVQDRSQQSLADDLHISKQVMSKIINGAKAINAMELQAIAKSLDVGIESLMNSPTPYVPTQLAFGFMGKITNEETQDEFNQLNEAIKEILLLEELLDE